MLEAKTHLEKIAQADGKREIFCDPAPLVEDFTQITQLRSFAQAFWYSSKESTSIHPL